MTNFTIGQYYPADSFIHRLDPRIKLLGVVLYITVLFFVDSFIGYGFVTLCLAVVIALSHVPPRFMFKGLKAILFIILFTVVINIFFTTGGRTLIRISFITITDQGLLFAVKMAARLILLIVGSSLLTLTTSSIELTDAIEYILKPFKRIGVPAHEIAMMMTIALRFIPTLMEEMDKIMKAQMARGADFNSGGLIAKAKSLLPLLVPLFISSFRRADELAMAMEARCYRGDVGRTRLKEMRLGPLDYKATGCLAVFVGVVLAMSFLL